MTSSYSSHPSTSDTAFSGRTAGPPEGERKHQAAPAMKSFLNKIEVMIPHAIQK